MKGVVNINYQEALEKVNSRLTFGIKPGLGRIAKLLEHLGNPQNQLKFTHVAGTNGKGTTCTLMASVLTESGLKTGLYTSPYVNEFRERFQINGEMISEQELAECVEKIDTAMKELEADSDEVTEFEFITAVAFLWFAEKKCDVVVLEVGLGGRLDTTNVISVPEAAVIMSISLDHTAILGNSIEEITLEKAGIIKKGGTVVLYPVQQAGVKETIQKVCEEKDAKLIIPDIEGIEIEKSDFSGTKFNIGDRSVYTPFAGEHQVYNAVTALAALQEFAANSGHDLKEEDIQKGFSKAEIPARMEVLSEKPLVMLEGGHNPGCAEALKNVLKKDCADKRITAIMGMMADKDVDGVIETLAPEFERLITVSINLPRTIQAELLAEKAKKYCENVYAASDMHEAASKAFEGVGEDDMVLICGSFYLAGEIKPFVEKYLQK